MITKSLLTLVALLFCATGLQAQQRIALLIGNQSYPESIGQLVNPHNDVARVADALRRAGFDDVQERKDRKSDDILGDLREFTTALKAQGKDTIGFFYYAGHGAAQKESKRNFILPVDATEPTSAELWSSAIAFDEITRRLREDAPDADLFVVFDSCRTGLRLSSPFLSNTQTATPALKQGGMIIAFATEDDHEASDGGEYAKALAGQIVEPPQSHFDLFQNVREKVVSATNGKQIPTELNGFRQRVLLSRPQSARGPRDQLEPVSGAQIAKPEATNSPAVIFARFARKLPELSKVYKAEFVSKKPEILRDNGTKKLVAWRINVSYDLSTYQQVAREMNEALSAVAKASAEGLTFNSNDGSYKRLGDKRIFAHGIEREDSQTIKSSTMYSQAEFGEAGYMNLGGQYITELFKNIKSSVGWTDGNFWVLLNQEGKVGGVMKFKGYQTPVEILPLLLSYAGGYIEINVTARNARDAELWKDGVADFEGTHGLTTDLVRTFIPKQGWNHRQRALELLDQILSDNTPDFTVPRSALTQPEDRQVKISADSFRKAWLASDLNQPGGMWYSSPENPTAVLIAPWFVLGDDNPGHLLDGFPAIYARWLTQDELDSIADVTVTVGE